jgi:P27 family predicted phage terminase small subunit
MERPYEMSDEVGAIWDRTVANLEAMNIASPSDVDMIAAYCEAVHLHHWASQKLAQLGSPLQRSSTPDRFQISKLVLIQERAAHDILRFGQEFGLSAASRTRVDVNHPLMSQGSYHGRAPKGRNPFAG